MNEDTGAINSPEAVIRDSLKRVARTGRRYSILGQCLVYGGLGATAVLLIVSLSRSDVPEVLRDVVMALGLGAAALGSMFCMAAFLVRAQRTHHQANKFEVDVLRHEVRAARPAEQADLGQVAAQMEKSIAQIQDLQSQLRLIQSSVNLSGGHLLRRVSEMEERVLADLGKAVKAVVDLRPRLDRLSDGAQANSEELKFLKADIETLTGLQRDLERDLAALVIGRQRSDSQVNGHANGNSSASVINLRPARPDPS